MSTETNKVTRRRRRTPARRVPAAIERRPKKPFIFGWGTDLTKRERDAIKERIALLGGIALAVVVAAIIGWGWYQDNIVKPAAIQAENNKPVVQVGSDVIHLGFFKRFVAFQKKSIDSQISQLQQQLSLDQANPKKNAGQISAIQQQITSYQQQEGTLASSTLTELIDSSVVRQRAHTVGVTPSKKAIDAQMLKLRNSQGGPIHFQLFLKKSGLTLSEIRGLVTDGYLTQQVSKKVQATVGHEETKVRASHILLPATQKALAEKLYKEAVAGADFAALARKYSTDKGSAAKGGDVGYFGKGQMVPQFQNAAFAMKPGQIRLVQSQYGWHIIKVTGRERVAMTPTEYQQAQQSAFQGWLAKQKGILHVQRFIATNKLPGNSSTPSSVPGQVTGQTPSQPSQPVQPAPQAPSSSSSGSSGKKP